MAITMVNRLIAITFSLRTITVAALLTQSAQPSAIPPPPSPESVDIIELPLPPVAPSIEIGSCTAQINPHGTGCILKELGDYEFQAGDFSPDGNHVIVNVKFVGAPAVPDPASIYDGEQLILVKADGTTFSNGDTWKCLSCAVPNEQKYALDPQRDYPHVFRSGNKAMWGHNILDCSGHQLVSDDCTPDQTHIYPIYWPIIRNGSEVNGAPRELRLHPDDMHLGWSSFTDAGGQNTFFGRLVFNARPTTGNLLAARFELIDVNLLYDPARSQRINTDNATLELTFNDDVIGIGELRGFSGTGDEILYIGPSREANNIDVFAVHVITGVVRRLTQHPEYTDPIAFSADNKWFVVLDTRGSDRQMFMSGMRHIPPLIDLVTVTVASSTRNNGNRRFFQPILIDRYGDRGDYFGQQLNAGGDPNWNSRADPAFSHDGTKIVYWQAIVTGRECGGINPLPCPIPNTPGQREYRLMLAHLTSRDPQVVPPVFNVPDHIPWAQPFPPGSITPEPLALQAGEYILRGKASGMAEVQFISSAPRLDITTVAVKYTEYSDVEGLILNGWENVTRTILWPNPWDTLVDWYSDLTQTGIVNATKKTSTGGFHLQIDAILNIFNANGTLRTTIDGNVYDQPANGT
ncbi:hypothetical protein BKA66DRAFT_574948 [Pyrenochaeta sp. MPI-SDFR-AT-0127]|nr:hypothetical protein BKA66DRAFT_574948 [Pyrenochaeta sp. MPI-SDFR-AT-0127]